jgi:type IV pilus assembly protein PilA
LRAILLTILGIFVAIILIILSAALPKLKMARMYAQETAALRAIQTLNTAEVQYNSTFGRYATSLAELGPPPSGTASAFAANLIPAGLASGTKQGYKFTLSGAPGGYAITAVPVAFNSTGSRTFYSDQTLTLRENDGQEPATANSPEVGRPNLPPQ